MGSEPLVDPESDADAEIRIVMRDGTIQTEWAILPEYAEQMAEALREAAETVIADRAAMMN